MIKVFVFLVAVSTFFNPEIKALAGDVKKEKDNQQEEKNNNLNHLKPENFLCHKFQAENLSAFKQKLMENCNLNKPFSSSFSRGLAAGEDLYLFCCHTKKE